MPIKLKEKPVFMIGPERSGTTLVMAMLGCHPRIAVPEVVWYYPRFYPYLHTFGDLSQEENLRTLANEMFFGLKSQFWGMHVNPRTIVDEVIALSPERSFAGLYAGMHEYFAQSVSKPRWGEKTPYNLFFVGPMHVDFPDAKFIWIVRDGRDACADYLESSFGPTNIYSAAHIWKRCMNAVQPWREKLLPMGLWCDIRYEELVRNPEAVLKRICDFLDEQYYPQMLEFHQTSLARNRGSTHDHKPLGHAVSDRYIGIYKDLLSLRDQSVFAAVAGAELIESGYQLDVRPAQLSEEEITKWKDWDGRIRAATLDGPEGHITFESYNDWLVDQRERRKKKGIWKDSDNPNKFPIGDPDEEIIAGHRAHLKWKKYFCVKRQYEGQASL